MPLLLRALLLTLLVGLGEVRAQRGGTGGMGEAEAGALVPRDTTRWRLVATARGTRVYLDAASLGPAETVVEVWTWHALPRRHHPRQGPPYDRVLRRDRVYCRLGVMAPLQVVTYLGRATVGGFLFPHDVGPFAWAAGSVEASVAWHVCEEVWAVPPRLPR